LVLYEVALNTKFTSLIVKELDSVFSTKFREMEMKSNSKSHTERSSVAIKKYIQQTDLNPKVGVKHKLHVVVHFVL